MITIRQAATLAEARGILEAIQDRASEIDTHVSGIIGARADIAEQAIFDTLNGLANCLDHHIAAAALHELIPAELIPNGTEPAGDETCRGSGDPEAVAS